MTSSLTSPTRRWNLLPNLAQTAEVYHGKQKELTFHLLLFQSESGEKGQVRELSLR